MAGPVRSFSASGLAGDPAAGLLPGRRVGQHLDALLRLAKDGRSPPREAVERALAVWWEAGASAVVLEPTALKVDGTLVLDPSETDVRWVLLAYMAGLRSVRPEPGATVEDLALLAAELGALEPTCASLARFRDWIWADGAVGFSTEVRESFLDALDGFAGELPLSEPPPMGKASQERLRPASLATPQQLEVAVRFLDDTLHAEESASPEGCGTLTPLDLALPESLRARLLQACEAAPAWTLAEARAALTVQASGVVPLRRQSAEALPVAFGEAPDLELLESLAAGAREGDSNARNVLALLDDEGLGDRVAEALVRSGVSPLRIAALVSVVGDAFARALLRALLFTDLLDDESAALLVSAMGVDAVLARVALDGLDHRAATTLLRVLSRAEVDGDVWVRVVKALSPAVALSLLGSLPVQCFRGQAAALAEFAMGLDPQELAPHIVLMADRLGPNAVRFFGMLLRASRGGGWSAAALRAVASLLVDAGAGRAVLVPLVRSREVDAQVRLHLLRDLEDDREALAEAVQKRVGELLDPPEVRERFKALRGALGQDL